MREITIGVTIVVISIINLLYSIFNNGVIEPDYIIGQIIAGFMILGSRIFWHFLHPSGDSQFLYLE